MKVVITNFPPPIKSSLDFDKYWKNFEKPLLFKKTSLFEYKADWGFHIYALGVYLMDKAIADEVEFWDYSPDRKTEYHPLGILRVLFHNLNDIISYMKRFGYPDLLVNHGYYGRPLMKYLRDVCFCVHVPALRQGIDRFGNFGAHAYLVDSPEYTDKRAMLYVPVVNTDKFRPAERKKERDFIYLASNYRGKRHDIIIKAVHGQSITGHFHPVKKGSMDLKDTNITTSDFNEEYVPELLQSSRIAVYPGDNTSNPAAMWECVATGLPIVVNKTIRGGKHLVIPGITGEFADRKTFYPTMRKILDNIHTYKPREYFMGHWNALDTLEKYVNFFRKTGLRY